MDFSFFPHLKYYEYIEDQKGVDCLIMGINSDGQTYYSKNLPNEIKELIERAFSEKKFDGSFAKSIHFSINTRPYFCYNLVLIGLGDKATSITDFQKQKLYKEIDQNIKKLNAQTATLLLDDFLFSEDPSIAIKHTITALGFLDYSFKQFKTSKDQKDQHVDLYLYIDQYNSETKDLALTTAKTQGQALSKAMSYARDLEHLPGNIANPAYLAQQAQKIAENEPKLKTKILGKDDLLKENMNAYLAVCSGSEHDPQMCIMDYVGNNIEEPPIVFIGKGLTFDSGGLSLKPANGMDEMKYDKCGACVVIALMKLIAELKLPLHVIGIAACAENMPDSRSYRPGDFIKSREGVTIEVANTDAEGRMVLCDALSYAKDHFKPKAIIDLATLTGGCIIALGHHMQALFTNKQDLADELLAAAKASQDATWQLPLDDQYQELIDSKLADITNSAGREASPITAAAFLSRFVGNVPWVHLDIAGTAWNANGYKHPTGRPLPLLFEYLLRQAQ